MQRFCIKLASIALVLSGAAPSSAAAQDPKRFEPMVVNGNDNQTSKAQLDLLAKKAGDDKLIILIARLGSTESTRRLNKRRLRTIRDYLKDTRAISEQKIITAEGERAKGGGSSRSVFRWQTVLSVHVGSQ